VNVELAEKNLIVEDVKTAQNAKSKSALNTWVNILEIIKNNRAKSNKVAVEVYISVSQNSTFLENELACNLFPSRNRFY
jgi:hypothetical protein